MEWKELPSRALFCKDQKTTWSPQNAVVLLCNLELFLDSFFTPPPMFLKCPPQYPRSCG